jgi:hypothetical protein
MELEPYVNQVRTQLAAAAALGDDATRATAAALTTAAGPAVRLALLGAATSLGDDITAALLDIPGAPAVSVRLNGDELDIEVRRFEPGDAAVAAPVGAEDGDSTARISLRLPETLKAQIEGAAREQGVSVNTWILRAAATALSDSTWGSGGRMRPGHRLTGWING